MVYLLGGGIQQYNDKGNNYHVLAVRNGLAVVPETDSIILFVIGGAVLAGLRKLLIRRY